MRVPPLKRSVGTDFWSRLNSRIDGHIARGEAHEAAIDETLAKMAADQEAERAFIERWNAMSYDEAVAFMARRDAAEGEA